jgi:hypothetical protein
MAEPSALGVDGRAGAERRFLEFDYGAMRVVTGFIERDALREIVVADLAFARVAEALQPAGLPVPMPILIGAVENPVDGIIRGSSRCFVAIIFAHQVGEMPLAKVSVISCVVRIFAWIKCFTHASRD